MHPVPISTKTTVTLNVENYENFQNNNNIYDKYYKCSGKYSMLIGNC